MGHNYKIITKLSAEEAQQIQQGEKIRLGSDSSNPEIILEIGSIEVLPTGVKALSEDFKKLIRALVILFKGSAAKISLATISMIYLALTPSGISAFFVRGWRLGIISRMGTLENKVGIAPQIRSLTQIGHHINEGIKLVLARFIYDIPKILVLVVVGYDYASIIVDFGYFFLSSIFNSAHSQSLSSMIQATSLKMSNGIIASLVFFALYSLIVTPAFKILEIKYALNQIKYSDFFNLKELFSSLNLYRKYTFNTLEMYFWDLFVTTLSLLVGFFLFSTFPLLIFLHPLWKLPFSHWAKSYGYGLLARRLIFNNELKVGPG